MAERRLLLLSRDWQTRALVLAELKERGYEVLALPGLTWGVKALVQGRVEPPLIIVDSRDDPDVTPETVRALHRMAPRAPIILLTTVFDRATLEPIRPEVAAFLVRPFTVGEVVEAVERLLPPTLSPTGTETEGEAP
ncbi:MAG: response regulator [Ardenticatenia bacterium]|nr:MAG: response regulator [Ardenticatenia bacterium]